MFVAFDMDLEIVFILMYDHGGRYTNVGLGACMVGGCGGCGVGSNTCGVETPKGPIFPGCTPSRPSYTLIEL